MERAHGWHFSMPHFRGCSGELNLAPRAYHSGDFADVGWMLGRMRERACAPVLAAGVSLGGNALLRWAEEAGNAAACKPKKVDSFGSETNIIWGPDNKQFAFVGHPGQFSSTHLMLATVDGGKAVDLLAAWKFEPGQIEWFKDGKIRMTTTTGGAAGLWQVDPATKQVSPILGGRRVVGDIVMDKAQTKLVYTSSDVSHLAEYYTSDIN